MHRLTIKLEEGVAPLVGRQRYPFEAMKPGNSFLVVETTDSHVRFMARKTLYAAAKRFMAKHPEVKLLVSADGFHVRCWRLE